MVINLERSYVLVMVQAGVLISRLGVSGAPFVVAPFLARVEQTGFLFHPRFVCPIPSALYHTASNRGDITLISP